MTLIIACPASDGNVLTARDIICVRSKMVDPERLKVWPNVSFPRPKEDRRRSFQLAPHEALRHDSSPIWA